MVKDYGLDLSMVNFRKGGLYQVLQPLWSKGVRREVTWGNNVATFSNTNAYTFGHEFGHIIQLHTQGWGLFQGKGILEQLFLGQDAYITPGTQEYDANSVQNWYEINYGF